MRYATIKENDIANGDGVVVSIWTQGCSRHCSECQNPTTWSFEGGKPFTNETSDYIISIMNNNNIERNLALLGGEPLENCNLLELKKFLDRFKSCYPNKKIYLWSGYTYEDIMIDTLKKEILEYIDILIDGKYEKSLRDITLKFRGSSNQRVIDVQKSLLENKIILVEGIDK